MVRADSNVAVVVRFDGRVEDEYGSMVQGHSKGLVQDSKPGPARDSTLER